MSRITPYLGIVVALILGVFIVAFSGSVTIVRTAETQTASSTLSVVSSFSLPSLSLSSLQPEKNSTTTTPTPITVVPKKTKVPSAPSSSTSTSSVPTVTQPVSAPMKLTSSGNISLDDSASALRGALVNIICYVPPGSSLHSMSGSGIIIDPKGIILTNAHIAQYFLLTDRGVSCTIRSGSPAIDKYDAALIYISPAWLRANASVLTEVSPSGTGEYDFALLAITKSETSTVLPSSFPSLPLAQLPPALGTPVVIASYGAQFLETNQVQSSLFPTIVFGSVKEIFTFAVNTIDVLGLGGSAAAQEGSSGGGVSDSSGNLIGTITTSTILGATDTRSLDAITASYIRAQYATETGEAINLLLAEPTATAIADFVPRMPKLEAILTAHLP